MIFLKFLMRFQHISSNFLKLASSPIFLIYLFLDININILNKEVLSNPEIVPASEKDLYLYKGMGASYLCIADKAGIEFPKAIGIATATYVQVLEGKHGGLVKELGDNKLEREKLIAGAEFQIVTTAMKYCPDSVPKDVKKKVNKLLKTNKNKK